MFIGKITGAEKSFGMMEKYGKLTYVLCRGGLIFAAELNNGRKLYEDKAFESWYITYDSSRLLETGFFY